MKFVAPNPLIDANPRSPYPVGTDERAKGGRDARTGAKPEDRCPRLWCSQMEMARIGPVVAGGNNRQTLTDEDGEGRALFRDWCVAAGLTVGVDRMGNMFARREGADPTAPPVYVGSHLDTQPTGGKYDGVLGVLGGLEIIRTMNVRGIQTKHPVVVANWTTHPSNPSAMAAE